MAGTAHSINTLVKSDSTMFIAQTNDSFMLLTHCNDVCSINRWLSECSRTCPTCRKNTPKAVVLFLEETELNSAQLGDDVDSLQVWSWCYYNCYCLLSFRVIGNYLSTLLGLWIKIVIATSLIILQNSIEELKSLLNQKGEVEVLFPKCMRLCPDSEDCQISSVHVQCSCFISSVTDSGKATER